MPNYQHELNEFCRLFDKMDLGGKIQALITLVNEVKADHNSLISTMKYLVTGDPALAIATTKTKVKLTGALNYFVNGASAAKAATDNLWTPTGLDATNATHSACWLCLDASGTATIELSTALSQASLALTVAGLPTPVSLTTKVIVGRLAVNPTGTGNFVGATTDLDDGTVVPNAAFVDYTLGTHDPGLMPSVTSSDVVAL